MFKRNQKYFFALSTMIGTMIGVGIFGIPYVLVKAGFGVGVFYFLILGIMVLLVNLFYGEIILRTKEDHRLVGYAQTYLGLWGKRLVTLSNIAGFYGAILAYIIIGGQFLFLLLSPLLGGSNLIYTLIFFSAGSLAILVGLALIAEAELVMNVFLLLTFAVIFIFSAIKINPTNLSNFNPAQLFLPYGVILFALGSLSAIPEVREVMGSEAKRFKSVITWGTIIPIIVTFLFVLAVVGAIGPKITPEAIASFKDILGAKVYALGLFFGFLAVTTSFLVIGLNLKRLLVFDYRLNNFSAWILGCFVPLLIFLFGSRDFIKVIGTTGGILGGLDGIIVSLIYLRAKRGGDRTPEFSLKLSNFVPYLVIGIFGLGVLYEIYYSIFV